MKWVKCLFGLFFLNARCPLRIPDQTKNVRFRSSIWKRPAAHSMKYRAFRMQALLWFRLRWTVLVCYILDLPPLLRMPVNSRNLKHVWGPLFATVAGWGVDPSYILFHIALSSCPNDCGILNQDPDPKLAFQRVHKNQGMFFVSSYKIFQKPLSLLMMSTSFHKIHELYLFMAFLQPKLRWFLQILGFANMFLLVLPLATSPPKKKLCPVVVSSPAALHHKHRAPCHLDSRLA